MACLALLCLSFGVASAADAQLPLTATATTRGDSCSGANLKSARANANGIFNSLHSAMRQWGSSIRHNGMSFIPATVPEGTLLYHGQGTVDRVEGMEWLSFEIEHAEAFAVFIEHDDPPLDAAYGLTTSAESGPHQPFFGISPHLEHISPLQDSSQMTLFPNVTIKPGVLQQYRTNRPLRLLYIDGMGAAKSKLGTLDTQDKVLLNNRSATPRTDRFRAKEICEASISLGVEGFIRMEAGFEVIKCNFSEGLDYVSHAKRPSFDSIESQGGLYKSFEWLSAAASRNQGIGGERVLLDYSSMISAYFYPINLTNFDEQRPELPRLANATQDELNTIRFDLLHGLAEGADSYSAVKSGGRIDWQGVVDMIVARYSNRLKNMSQKASYDQIVGQINTLLNIYFDFDDAEQVDAMSRCSKQYLPFLGDSATFQDKALYVAVEEVSRRICATLFDIRGITLNGGTEGETVDIDSDLLSGSPFERMKLLLEGLMDWLQWTDWRKCDGCPVDCVCMVPMFPFGKAEDHFHPTCKNATTLADENFNTPFSDRYW